MCRRKRWTHLDQMIGDGRIKLDQMIGDGRIKGARCPSGPSAPQAIACPLKTNRGGDLRICRCTPEGANCDRELI